MGKAPKWWKLNASTLGVVSLTEIKSQFYKQVKWNTKYHREKTKILEYKEIRASSSVRENKD